tara:strand:- start:158 stop:2257 length:2100 start_codon:yes stop_codon:yes gene_type:complete
MALKKLQLKSGVNKENTRYTNENGWFVSEKIRFRQGTPEKIGGWVRISSNVFQGVCRSLWNWITLGGQNLLGVGTNLKFYIENGGAYNDITPLRVTPAATLGNNPFATTNLSTTVVVTDATGGWVNGDFVTFSGATAVGGLTLNGEYQISTISTSATTYSIQSATAATSTATGGGASVVAAYQLNVGAAYAIPVVGWGAGAWGSGTWGVGVSGTTQMRIWSQVNYGQDLIFAPNNGAIYIWQASGALTTRGVLLSSLGGTVTVTSATPAVVTSLNSFSPGAALQFDTTGTMPTGMTAGTTYYVAATSLATSFTLTTAGGAAVNTTTTGAGVYISNIVDVPTIQSFVFVSDTSRFVFAFGCNNYGSAIQDPMLIRWSAQSDYYNWTPDDTNQANFTRLSHGSEIVACVQARQEIVVFTDSALYSLQYQGPPAVWASQLLGDNISILGPNAAIAASGVIYWMGVDKFYKYDGRIQTLRCDLLRYVYQDINLAQSSQVFAATNEGFNEVWWFYCSATSAAIDLYVIYNYTEDVWSYGTLGRTAWLDSGLRDYPLAATYSYNLVNHEQGNDDNVSGTPAAISALIGSSEFDIDDGDHFGFVWRMLPDITFRGSDAASPQVTMTLIPMQNSGSGYNNPVSVGGNSSATITRTSTSVIEQFTGQVYVRVRGRQMIIQVESNQLGCAWQLGSPRIDIKQDGRRGNS